MRKKPKIIEDILLGIVSIIFTAIGAGFAIIGQSFPAMFFWFSAACLITDEDSK